MGDDLPPGFSVISMGGNSPPPAPASDGLPEGFGILKMRADRSSGIRPHANAFEVANALYPGLRVTDWKRNPKGKLGRKNPASWHVRSGAAIDSAPVEGMSFTDYVEGYRRAGFPIIEAIDEVNNPSSHATGPHWHVVLGEREEQPETPATVASPSIGAPPPVAPREGGDSNFVQDGFSRQIAAMVQAQRPVPEILAFAQEQGRPFSPEQAVQLGEAHKQAAVPGARVVGGFDASEAAPAQETAGLSEHRPDLAERLGNTVGDLSKPLLGGRGGERFGNKVEGLLDWTTVGDVDAYRDFGERQELAAKEGRFLDVFGNMVGQDISAASMFPIVGTVRKGAKAVAQGAESLAERVMGRGSRSAADAAPDGAHIPDALPDIVPPARQRDYINVGDLPPGFSVLKVGDGPPVTAQRQFRPEDVRPIPGNRPEGGDEMPTSIRAIEGPPSPGRAPARPPRFSDHLRASLASESASRGVRVRLDAEDAIDKGVPADMVYLNPNVADKSKLRVRHPAIFGTRYGRMSADQQVLRSLDMDGVDPVEWGFDHLAEGRMEPEDIGDLLGRSLAGDDTALRRGPDFDEYMHHQELLGQKAEFEGRFPDAPPVHQVGEPIGADDLAKLVPPDSAYEDAPRMVGRVGNLNLERVDRPEEVSRLVQRIRANVPEIDEARGGRLANEELKNLARDLNVKPDRILSWRKEGGLPSPSELFAWRVIVHQGRQKVAALAKRTRGATDEEMARFHNVVMKQAALERQLAGAAAESGRLLQQFNAIARTGDASDAAIKAYLRSVGGRETVEEIADKIVDLVEDPQKAGTFIQNVARIRKRDMFNEYWINALLSGVPTHLVNFGGNGLVALLTLPEEALGAAFGKFTRSQDRAHLRDVAARAWGMVQGAREGLTLARQAFRTGEPSDLVSKVEATNYQAIPGKLGHFIRTPTRALTAADEFWAAIHRRGAINAGAMREALNGPGSMSEKLARYAELRDNPSDKLGEFARQEALYRTYRKQLGEGGRAIQNVSNNFPGAKIVMPFVRTPINILKYAGERSPLAVMAPAFWRDIKAGGIKRDAALAKLTIGSGLAYMATEAALNGRISGGGPTDYKERSALMNSGWQPYSIKVGDKWVSYQRLEPLSVVIGATADFVEMGKWATEAEADKLAIGIAAAIAKNLTSKTWLSGPSGFFEMLTDPGRYGENYMERLAGSLAVPAFVGNAARAVDPEYRQVEGILDAIKNRVPHLSRDLAPRRNVWGEPVKRGNMAGTGVAGAAYSYVSPIMVKGQSADPVMREAARLRAPLSMPQRAIRVAGVNRKLTPEQYSFYVQLSGIPAKAYLSDFIKSPDWRAMTDDERRDHMKETLTEFRAVARDELRAIYPELADDGGALPPGFSVVQ